MLQLSSVYNYLNLVIAIIKKLRFKLIPLSRVKCEKNGVSVVSGLSDEPGVLKTLVRRVGERSRRQFGFI